MVETSSPREEVLSEVSLLEWLNIELHTLDGLRRERGFPYVRLTTRIRVYLVKDVLAWLQQHRATS